MNTLFKESDIFIKDRPTKLTENQTDDLYKKLAKEVINNKWANSDIDSVCEDLKELSLRDSGYELAKELEMNNGISYDFTIEFLEWLEDLESRFDDELTKIVEKWVKAHDIKPKFKVGDKIFVNHSFSNGRDEFSQGTYIYIHLYDDREAKYYITKEEKSKQYFGFIIEKIESCCI